MTQQEILSLVAAGYSKADIDALSVNQQVQAPQPVQTQTPVVQPVQTQTQPQSQPVQTDFISQLAALGALINATQTQSQPIQTQTQPQPIQTQPQSIQPQPVQEPQTLIAQTPSNQGLTPEEATKLFQAWSRGSARQEVELPPSADEVLAKRFASLYGADITKPE